VIGRWRADFGKAKAIVKVCGDMVRVTDLGGGTCVLYW
jgi:hypothetical protein